MFQWITIWLFFFLMFLANCIVALAILGIAKLFKYNLRRKTVWFIALTLSTIELLALILMFFYARIKDSQRLLEAQEQYTMPSYDTTKLKKTSEMIDEARYWQVIEGSLQKNGSDQEQLLRQELGKLSSDELIGFKIRTMFFLHDTYNSEMWCAGYIMNNGCSDDGFEYFRCWIISRGKEVFYKAKQNPDNLVDAVINREVYEYEPINYLPLDIFKRKTGKELHNYIDYDSVYKKQGAYKDIKFNWREDDRESMRKICPKLFDKLWN